jgi:hypothetical protein
VSEAAEIPVSRVEWKGAVRIIRSAFPPIDLFEDIADPADWPLLISAEQKTNPRIMATIGNLDLVPVDRRVGGNMAQGLTSDRGIAVMDSRERNLANQQTFLVTITRLRDGLTLFVDNAGKLEASVDRNPGMKRSALETVDQLRDAAAMGQAKGKARDKAPEPRREPPELDRSITKPFEIGI